MKPGRVPAPDGEHAGPPPRRHRPRPRAAEAARDSALLPRRGRKRTPPTTCSPSSTSRAGVPRRPRGGRRPAFRHPPPGRRRDDVLRRMTTFGPLFVPEELLDAVSGRAWLEAMLEFESALARAEAAAGIVPPKARRAIAEKCDGRSVRLRRSAPARALGRKPPGAARARAARRRRRRRSPLRALGRDEPGRHGHRVDARRAARPRPDPRRARRGSRPPWRAGRVAPVDADGGTNAAAAGRADDVRVQGCGLARRACSSREAASRLGSDASGWPCSSVERRARSRRSGSEGRRSCGCSQTTSDWPSPCCRGIRTASRIAELGAALATTAGVLGEDRARRRAPRADRGRRGCARGPDGGSSTLPHKRNPVSVDAGTGVCPLVSGLRIGPLSVALDQEHERAAGAWHAEWEALSGALAFTGGAAHAIAHGRRLARDRRRADARATSTRPTASSSPSA